MLKEVGKNSDKILTDEIEVHIIELPKLRNANIEEDQLELWLKFIQDSSSKEVNEKMKEIESKELKQAKEELKYLSGDPAFKQLGEKK